MDIMVALLSDPESGMLMACDFVHMIANDQDIEIFDILGEEN